VGRLALRLPGGHDRSVEPVVEREDVTSVLNGIFDMNRRLARIADDVRVIRLVLENDDEEEEEEADGPDG
jgi:hypothetical protein